MRLRKFFLWFSGILIAVLLLLVVAAFVFEDQLVEKARTTISNELGIELNAEDLSVTAFSSFPNLSIEAKNVSIEERADKYALSANNLELIVGLSSLTSEILDVKDLVLSNGKMSFFKSENQNKKANIQGNAPNFDLKKLSLSNIDVSYVDPDLKTELFGTLQQFKGSLEWREEFSFKGDLLFKPSKVVVEDVNYAFEKELKLEMTLNDSDLNDAFNPLGTVYFYENNTELEVVINKEALELNGEVEGSMLDCCLPNWRITDGLVELSKVIVPMDGKSAFKEGQLKIRNLDFLNAGVECTISARKLELKDYVLSTDKLKARFGNSEIEFDGDVIKEPSRYLLKGSLQSDELYVDDILDMLQDTSESEAINIAAICDFNFNKIEHGKWRGKKIIGTTKFEDKELTFDAQMNTFRGEIMAEGSIKQNEELHFRCKSSFKELEVEEVLDEWENLGQEMITSDNLDGELSGHGLLDFYISPENEINKNKSTAKLALAFEKGKLTDLKMMEDFSKYISLDDLMDIRFENCSNLIEWKGDFLSIPMMFINNNAANISLSGFHDINNKFVYNIQLNASDVLARKLGRKKSNARRKGWWNMYYVIQGQGSEFEMLSDKERVKKQFRQSKNTKREIFKTLLNEFGNTPVLQDLNDWRLLPDA